MGIMRQFKPGQLRSGSLYPITSSFALTASYAESALSASYAVSASYEINYETSSSYAETASFVTGSDVFGPYGSNSVISASYAVTASYANNAGIDTGSLVSTASFNAFTASYTTGSFTGSFTGDGSGLTGVIPPLSSSYIFVGNAANVAAPVSMSGDVAIDQYGVTTIQPQAVSYGKIQYVSQSAVLGSMSGSGTPVTEIPIIESYLTSSVPATLLNDANNWDINGNYIGTAISGTYQGQSHYNANYWYTAVDDNTWIRLIRG